MQADTSDVLSVLAAHLPIQPAKRYGEKLCFVKYHVSEDKSSIVESSGGVHTRANVQNAPGHGHFLEMTNTAYHCPYDLIDNKVNAIYIVYKRL